MLPSLFVSRTTAKAPGEFDSYTDFRFLYLVPLPNLKGGALGENLDMITGYQGYRLRLSGFEIDVSGLFTNIRTHWRQNEREI